MHTFTLRLRSRAGCSVGFGAPWAWPSSDPHPHHSTIHPPPSPDVPRQFVKISPGTVGKPPSARVSLGPMTLSLYDFVLILQRTKLSLGIGWKSARFPPERLSA